MTAARAPETDTRAALDRELARDPVVGSEPRHDIYRRIGLHPNRLDPRSLPMEARVLVRSLLSNDTPRPFVIYGRPRSGTTLLVRLLDQVPQIRCDGELLHFFLVDPVGLLSRLPRRAGPDVAAYGVKLISYHVLEVQRIRHPLAFFDKIDAQGYSVLHLTRNTWDQTLSLVKAQKSNIYFSDAAKLAPVRIDPENFVEVLRWNEDMLTYERKVMSHVPHLHIDYDADLRVQAQHQSTIDRICTYLGTASAQVAAKSRRTGGDGGLQKVENMEELIARARNSDLAHLVPQNL